MNGLHSHMIGVMKGGKVKYASVNIQVIRIYGVEWDWTTSGSTKGVRTDSSSSFGDPDPAVNNGMGSSPFDDLYPWSEMTKETHDIGILVKEVKYWYKWTKTGKKLKLQIADGPAEGFYVDPVNMDREDGLGELDFSYVGRFHCASGTYKSETNVAQQVNDTRISAREAIHSLGDDVYQIDFAQLWYIGMLYLVEFADFDGQKTIGYGCSESESVGENGKTDAMPYHTGTTAANRTTYGFTQYRNIEGWWDNVYDWIDGCYYSTSGGLSVILNPNKFSDFENGVFIGAMPASGFPNLLETCDKRGFEWAVRPIQNGGNSSSYVPDIWYFSTNSPCLFHGGYYGHALGNGPFCIGCVEGSQHYDHIGSRLQKRPPREVQA